MRSIDKQGGWVGLIVLLLALVIVGFLAKDALKKYGLLEMDAATSSRGSSRGAASAGASGAALTGSVDASGVDIESAAPSQARPLDRARDLGAAMQQQADDLGKRIDAGAR